MKTRSTFRRCAFRPGGRFRNHLILAIRNAVGQLALGEDVARNVLSSCKLQGPQPSAGTLHRLDRVWRLDASIIANLSLNCNRASTGISPLLKMATKPARGLARILAFRGRF